MTSADIVRADQQAMLIVGTFTTAMQHDPAVWERFVNRLFDDWGKQSAADAASRNSTTEQAIAALGRIAAGRGTQSDLGTAPAGNDAQPTPAPSGSPPAVV